MSRFRYSVILSIIGFLLLSYSGYRAYNLSFTYDESSTVLEFVNRSYSQIFSTAPTANNHVLNTVLVKLFADFLPAHEFTYRLPNLLSHLLYLGFSILILGTLKDVSNSFRLSAFILINFNPYLLDFFSLARGYGLATSFTLGSIYFLIKWTNQWNILQLGYSLILAALAVLSNFTLLNLYLALLVVVASLVLIRLPTTSEKYTSGALVLFVSSLLAWLVYKPLVELVNKKELYFGGKVGVWSDTVLSLLSSSAYSINHQETILSLILFLALLFTIAAATIISLKELQREREPNQLLTVLGLLVVILIGVQVQHWLLGTPFIIERTALFLIPIFMVLLILAIHILNQKLGKLASAILVSLTLLFGTNLGFAINDSYYLDWKHESGTKQIMQSIDKHENQYETYFGVEWPYSVTARFYAKLFQYNWIRIIETGGYDHPSSHLSELDIELRTDDNDSVILYYADSRGYLEHSIATYLNSDTIIKESFIDLVKTQLTKVSEDSLLNIRVEAKVRQNATSQKPILKLVLASDNGELKSENPSRKSVSGWYNLSLTYRDVRPIDSQVLIYFWNVEQKEIEISDCKLVSVE